MKKKRFKKGFCILRMQHLHLGHQNLIDTGIEESEEFTVFIGSPQDFGTVRNPFSSRLRYLLLQEVYGDKINIAFLPDLTDESDDSLEWGNYIMENVRRKLGECEEYVSFVGSKDFIKNKNWYTDNNRPHIYAVDVSEVKISATELREMLINNDFENWKQLVDERLHNYFHILRSLLLKV